MNLALHGFLLQVILSLVDIKYGLCSAGEPGYLDFDNLPETNFSCQGKVIGGYYADVEAGCQMFHVCTIGQKDEIMDIKFLCLNGTVFDQETRVCERVDEVDCSKSERFYNLNLELYGNNAVTLSLQEGENEDDPPILIEDHHQTSSPGPTTTTTSTTQPPVISSTTSPNGPYQHPSGYPQHYQPQPPFPSVQTSQSKSHYDDKNGGFHRQYIYHDGDNTRQNDGNSDSNDNQATSYQLFSNQGGSSTTPSPQIHQISTVSPLYHATSSTLQSLLTGNNNNNPSLIFHNHGIVSTTEQFTVHNNNPRETSDYQRSNERNDNAKNNDDRRVLEPIQSTSQGKISKLTISPVPQNSDKSKPQNKQESQRHSQTHAISGGFLTIGPSDTGPPTIRSFYPTPKTSKTQSSTASVTHHIHLPPPPVIPQLKPHQVTIHLSPPEIQRLVQNPPPLLPSQSRVIVTAKASVSDESGRPLNTTQLVTLPLPTIPASYDDYKEGDESFDPFYRDVPKIRNSRRSEYRYRIQARNPRKRRSARNKREADDEKETSSDKTVIASSKSDQEDAAIASGELAEEDYSTVAGEEDYVSQERLDDSKLNEEYDEEYYDDSQQPKDLTSLEKAGRAMEDLENTYEEYGSQEYPLSEEIHSDDNQTESTTIAVEQETVVTETLTTTESIETTTVNPMQIETNKTVEEDSVLKFTEEIPGSIEEMEKEEEVKKKQREPNKQVNIPATSQDYVDDNYEPENYKEQVEPQVVTQTDKVNETKSSSIESATEKVVDVTVSAVSMTTLSETITTTSSTTPTAPAEISTEDLITTTTPCHTSETEIITTPSTTVSTTIATTTTVSSTNPPSPVTRKRYTTPSTTVYRPTNPKVKSFSTRRAYIYHPPTTTPIPVIIKTKMPLVNPKPAKPPKSYNELAPKPVIRKRPLLAIRTPIVEEELTTTEFSTTIKEATTTEEISETTTEQKAAILSEKLLEKISETIGEEIIGQINDLTTPAAIVDTNSSEKVMKNHSDATTGDTTLTGIIHEDVSQTPQIIHSTTSLQDLALVTSSTLASVLPVNRRASGANKPIINGFNCLEREMYKFYADQRDCRLFHYCSPGFTSRQVLDFRFVCEESTVFDEETQSCVHTPKNPRCKDNTWQ